MARLQLAAGENLPPLTVAEYAGICWRSWQISGNGAAKSFVDAAVPGTDRQVADQVQLGAPAQ